MKKLLASTFIVCSLAGAAYAGMEAATGVNGSLHDMTVVSEAYGDSMDRVCVFCHTPHNAVKDEQGLNDYPLWNHALSTAVFEPYRWATITNRGPNGNDFDIIDPLIGPSRLCMSCHDGSIAIDQHNGALGQPGNNFVSARANLGSDLTNDHPIGFDYAAIRLHRNTTGVVADPTTHDTEIIDPTVRFATSVTASSTPGVYNTVERAASGRKIGDVLYGGNIMTCASCHEVHNKENVVQDGWNRDNPVGATPTTAAPNYFLYAKQAQSLICLSCHVK